MKNLFLSIIEFIYSKIPGNKLYYDALTGINNFNYYNSVLKKKYLDSEDYIVFLDIDNLKEVNDNNGHEFGDKFIQTVVSNILTTNPDEFCRLHGDEFILIFKNEPLLNLKYCSYGMIKKKQIQTLSEAVQDADLKMYQSKKIKHSTR